jgi:hypothetical protein
MPAKRTEAISGVHMPMLIREAWVADIPALTEIRLAVKENLLNKSALVTYTDYVVYLTRRSAL